MLTTATITIDIGRTASGSEAETLDSPLRAKWGTALEAGFVAFPSVLLTHFKTLDVTPTEFLVVLNLVAHWWEADRKPFPRVGTIARRLNVQPRTVQRALNKLRSIGLIDWERVQVQNGKVLENPSATQGVRRRRYDLTKLVRRAEHYAEHRKITRARRNSGVSEIVT